MGYFLNTLKSVILKIIKNMKQLGDILPKHIKKQGLSEQLEASQVLETFLQKAKEMWGEAVKQEMKPLYVKNKTLTVAVTNASLAQELKHHEKEILEHINSGKNLNLVERLRYLL